MRRLIALLLAAAAAAATARAGIECESTADCAANETCVAGDSVAAIQQCVSGAACGGARSGACPSDDDSGQLACIWRAGCSSSGSSGCAEVDGTLGIYKCLSVARCDEYFGDSACSAGCTDESGEQCGGRGSCQLDEDSSAGSPSFSCVCESGFSGATCSSGSASGSSSSSLSAASSLNASASASASASHSGSTESSGSTEGSGSIGLSGSTDRSGSAVGSGAANNVAGSAQSDDNQITSDTSSGGSGSTVVIIVAVLAAVVLIGALAFAVYARRKRNKDGGEDPDGFSRAETGSDPDMAAATGPDTPKNNIVIM